ncbi:hypothetical protein DL768_001132 [Monosporascus sp. mg162]|nr:hypothetical protein DL768_001132 [Monosporascus sp. mg162]
MSVSPPRKRKRPGDKESYVNWGSNFQDFTVREGRAPQASKASLSGHKRRNCAENPTLPPQTDEWHRLVSTIAAEQHIDEVLDLAADPDQDDLGSSDISDVDDGDGHDDDHSSTIDDADSQHLSGQSIDCLTLNAVLDGLVAAYNQEIPKLDSIPEPQRGNIERHDIYEVGSAPFSHRTLKWLQANAGPQTRNAILEFLLHPLIRSYRVRSVLGRRSHTHVFDDLETFPLSWDARDIPHVLGIYTLHATQNSTPTAGESTQDPAYVGKAAGVSPDSAGHTLLPRRAREHVKGIKSAKKKIAGAARNDRPVTTADMDSRGMKQNKLGWYYEQLADASLGPVRLAVLSTLPLTEVQNENYFLHLDFLLALAESIDAVFLGTLSSTINPFTDIYAAWYGAAYRPQDMPPPAFRGLNRALPLKQGCKPFGAHSIRFLCSRTDMDTMIQVSRDFETAIYNPEHSSSINWELIASLLRERGVDKNVAEIQKIYRHLAARPYTGFISCRSSKFRCVWNQLYLFKQHLSQKGLVQEPTDGNDLFFHIPALEDSYETSSDVERMLRHSGFTHGGTAYFLQAFLPRYLPSLLHKDVWPQISERLKAFGLVQLARIYGSQSPTFWHPSHLEDLPPWRYDPAQDGYEAYQDDPKETASMSQKSSLLSNSENNEGCEVDESALTAATKSEELFEWPSDDVRYKALSSTFSGVLDPELKASTLPEEQLEILLARVGPTQFAQHRTSTLRILISIMRSQYQDIFNGEQEDANDNHFWTMLFIGPLNLEWKIEDVKVLRYRFGWVLEYIRTGTLSPEAVLAQDIMREALEESVLARTQHPYNYDKLFIFHSDRGKLDARLKRDLPSYSFYAFCDRYGILIPQLWEESALRFKLMVDPVFASGPLPLDPALTAQPATLSGSTSTEQDKETAYGESIPKNVASGSRETNSEAQSMRREHSSAPRRKAQPSSTERKTRKAHSTFARLWTPDRCAFLERLVQTADDWDDAIEKLRAEFGLEYSASALGYQARKQGLDIARISRSLIWTTEHEEYLASLLPEKPINVQQAIKHCVKMLNEKFHVTRSYNSVYAKAGSLGLIGQRQGRSSVVWNTEEIKFLHSLQGQYLTTDQVRDRVWGYFGTKRSSKAIGVKWFELLRNSRTVLTLSDDGAVLHPFSWTPEEDQFILEWEGNDLDALVDAFEAKFPHRRSRLAIRERWRRRDSRSPGGPTRRILRWTVEEDNFIKEWSGTVFPEFAKAFHERFLGRRTTKALRGKRTVLRNKHSASTVQRCDTNWTPEEDEMIREWPASEEDTFFDAFNERFTGRRTRRSLMIRWREVRGLKKQGDSEQWQCRWSAEEDEFIITWPAENLIACEIAFQERFLGRRTKTAVRRRWDALRAKKMVKGDIAQLSGSVWLPEQNEFILNWPDNQRSKCIAAFQKRFPNLRTDSAIKNKWNLFRNSKNA